jgi:hypothetical protein
VKAGGKQSFKAGFLLGIFFDPEDGSDTFLRNVGCLSRDYTALYSRRELCITTAVRASSPTSYEAPNYTVFPSLLYHPS